MPSLPSNSASQSSAKKPFGAWTIVGLAVYLGLFFLVVGTLHHLNFWHRYYSSPTPLNLWYDILRLLFGLYLAALILGVGRALLAGLGRGESDFLARPAENFIFSFYLGAAAIIIGMTLLGILHLFYFPLILIITTGLLILTYSQLRTGLGCYLNSLRQFLGSEILTRDSRMQRSARILMALAVLAQVGFLAVFCGLYPDLQNLDSFSHYLPYYEKTIADHSTAPNYYWWHLFFTKGAGLNFLAAILADVQSIPLVTTLLYLLSGLVLFCLIRSFASFWFWPWAATLIYLTSPVIFQFEFAKLHIQIGVFIIGLAYLNFRLYSLPERHFSRLKWLQIVIHSAPTIMMPVSMAFNLPFILLQHLYFGIRGRRAFVRSALTIVAGQVILLSLILAYNYLSFGMAEISPVEFFYKYRNESTISKSIDPTVICLQNTIDRHQSVFTPHRLLTVLGDKEEFIKLFRFFTATPFPQHFILQKSQPDVEYFTSYDIPRGVKILYPIFNLAFIVIFISVAVSIILRLARRKPLPVAEPILDVFITCCLVFLVIGFNLMLSPSPSIYRFFWFYLFFLVVFLVFFLDYLTRIKPGRALRSLLVLFTLLYFVAIYGILLSEHSNRIKNTVEFAMGRVSYADIYAMWGGGPCLEAQEQIGKDKKVYMLSLIPGCNGIPGGQYKFSVMGDYAPGMQGILFGSPEEARRLLQSFKVNYFYVDLGQSLFITDYAPLFDQENLPVYFKVVWHKDQAYMLSWRQGEPLSQADQDFIKGHRLRRIMDKGKFWHSIFLNACQSCRRPGN